MDLEPFRLKSSPIETIYYLPNYISEEEEKKLVDAIYNDNNTSSSYGEKKGWVGLSKRRLKNLGGGMWNQMIIKQ